MQVSKIKDKDMTDYKKISRTISLMYAAMMFFLVTFVVLCESGVAQLEGMALATYDEAQIYYIQVFMFFYTGVCVLSALKGFNWLLKNKVHTAEKAERPQLYKKYHFIRIGLLAAVMLMGVLFYYTMLENWGLYYALIALVASFFCLPSPEGVEIEMKMEG